MKNTSLTFGENTIGWEKQYFTVLSFAIMNLLGYFQWSGKLGEAKKAKYTEVLDAYIRLKSEMSLREWALRWKILFGRRNTWPC